MSDIRIDAERLPEVKQFQSIIEDLHHCFVERSAPQEMNANTDGNATAVRNAVHELDAPPERSDAPQMNATTEREGPHFEMDASPESDGRTEKLSIRSPEPFLPRM